MKDFAVFASLLPAICGLCYGVILLLNRESRPKRILGLIYLISGFCWGTSMVMDNLDQQNGYVPIANTWHLLSDLMLWPLIGWYLVLLFRPDAKFFPKHFMQFLPFLIAIPCVFLIRLVFPPAPDVYSLKEFIALLPYYPELIFKLVLIVVFLIQTTFYFVRANIQLKEYQLRVKNDFSEMEDVDLRWISVVNLLFFLGVILNLSLAFTSDVQSRMWISIWGFFHNAAVAVIGGTKKDIYYLPDNTVPLDKQLLRPGNVSLFIPPEQEKTKMTTQVYDKIKDGLIDLFERKEIYCNPNLRLDDLSAMLHTNKTYVSTVINEHFRDNFYTVVNSYRIKKALVLLENPTIQIKNVWIQAGFNSQSSFNSLFKKEMRITPSEWIGLNSPVQMRIKSKVEFSLKNK